MSTDDDDYFERWQATIHYRTDSGVVPVSVRFEKLFELHDIVEHGYNWDCIVKIEVVLIEPTEAWLTVEESLQLCVTKPRIGKIFVTPPCHRRPRPLPP